MNDLPILQPFEPSEYSLSNTYNGSISICIIETSSLWLYYLTRRTHRDSRRGPERIGTDEWRGPIKKSMRSFVVELLPLSAFVMGGNRKIAALIQIIDYEYGHLEAPLWHIAVAYPCIQTNTPISFIINCHIVKEQLIGVHWTPKILFREVSEHSINR